MVSINLLIEWIERTVVFFYRQKPYKHRYTYFVFAFDSFICQTGAVLSCAFILWR